MSTSRRFGKQPLCREKASDADAGAEEERAPECHCLKKPGPLSNFRKRHATPLHRIVSLSSRPQEQLGWEA